MTASPRHPLAGKILSVVALFGLVVFAAGSVAADKPVVVNQTVAAPHSFKPTTVPAVVAETKAAVEAVDDDSELLQPVSILKPVAEPKTMRMLVTAYCPCTKCCGPNAQGITASGKPVSYNRGRFVAADKKVLSFGQKLSIPGYHGGTPVEVLDTGSAIKGHRLDVYFPSHQTALEWGKKWVDVVVVD